MAPHAQAARGSTLFAPCEDELNNWPRGHPADGGDDETGLKADGALSQKAAELLEACAEEPDGDRRLALARRAYAAAPTAKKARRAYALALATSKRWGLLADLLEKWDVASTFGDSGVALPLFGSRAQQDVQTAVAKSQSPPRGPMTSSWTVAQTTPLSSWSRT